MRGIGSVLVLCLLLIGATAGRAQAPAGDIPAGDSQLDALSLPSNEFETPADSYYPAGYVQDRIGRVLSGTVPNLIGAAAGEAAVVIAGDTDRCPSRACAVRPPCACLPVPCCSARPPRLGSGALPSRRTCGPGIDRPAPAPRGRAPRVRLTLGFRSSTAHVRWPQGPALPPCCWCWPWPAVAPPTRRRPRSPGRGRRRHRKAKARPCRARRSSPQRCP